MNDHDQAGPGTDSGHSSSGDSTAGDHAPLVDSETGENISWRTAALTMLAFDRAAPSGDELVELLHEVFDGAFQVRQNPEFDNSAIVMIEDASVYVQPADAPVPGGEATDGARGIPMWQEDASALDSHASHLMILAGREGEDGAEPEYLDPRAEALRCELAVAHVTAALTALPESVAVYVPTAHATLPAVSYREIVTGNALPVPAMVGVRAGWEDDSTASAYTSGMGRFGRHELQRIGAPGQPGELYAQICDLISYQLGTGTVFEPGVTLQLSEELSLRTELVDSRFGPWQTLDLSPADS